VGHGIRVFECKTFGRSDLGRGANQSASPPATGTSQRAFRPRFGAGRGDLKKNGLPAQLNVRRVAEKLGEGLNNECLRLRGNDEKRKAIQ
jgi:hypothetical protein